jgi:hypothetical protein
VVDTDMLMDALRGFGRGLDYIEDTEQHGTLHSSITPEMELIIPTTTFVIDTLPFS